jgi:hypothetical protein
VTFYDSDNEAIGAAHNLTQVGTTSWWKYSLDASATATWELGFNYHAEISWVDTDNVTHADRYPFNLDVVMWPFNEPLVLSASIDLDHPTWAGAMPKTWSDWSYPIQRAHLELIHFLRGLRNAKGERVYATRVLNRDKLLFIEKALARRAIADGLRLSDEDKKHFRDAAAEALADLTDLTIDDDDDLVESDDEQDQLVGTSFEH